MDLQLVRSPSKDGATVGRLAINGVFECWTLEDQIRPAKLAGITCIPAGRYQVVITYSSRFKRDLALLLAVPNFTGIRIHAGNTAADTEGCILVGQAKGTNSVLASKLALATLQPKIQATLTKGEQVWIDVINP